MGRQLRVTGNSHRYCSRNATTGSMSWSDLLNLVPGARAGHTPQHCVDGRHPVQGLQHPRHSTTPLRPASQRSGGTDGRSVLALTPHSSLGCPGPTVLCPPHSLTAPHWHHSGHEQPGCHSRHQAHLHDSQHTTQQQASRETGLPLEYSDFPPCGTKSAPRWKRIILTAGLLYKAKQVCSSLEYLLLSGLEPCLARSHLPMLHKVQRRAETIIWAGHPEQQSGLHHRRPSPPLQDTGTAGGSLTATAPPRRGQHAGP
ncbi:hypothetical protein GWK47_047805 [Chionoecetes opilio]|uniref:Uncharacterized protein n=1 Tax=Chionoecetes opilio TaxID=41210 RepID=A0A8J4Y4W5_CHIOP|nr:hypothetical protein GWK47_047805 [Chionoecetes opilio]